MALELCAANGASLRYESGVGERYGGGFVIEPEGVPLQPFNGDALAFATVNQNRERPWQLKQTA